MCWVQMWGRRAATSWTAPLSRRPCTRWSAPSCSRLPTGKGRLSAVDPDDIAAVAVHALLEDGHQGRAHTQTGPRALSYGEQAAELSRTLGREVRFVDVPAAAAREAMTPLLPADVVEAQLEFYALVRDGEREFVSTDVERVTGRPPADFAPWAERNAAMFG